MKNIIIDGYRRITKATARKLYNSGQTIRICAVNMSPVNIWGAYSDTNNREYANISSDGFNNTIARNKAFETVVNAFIYYNCNNEVGNYPAFYIREV